MDILKSEACRGVRQPGRIVAERYEKMKRYRVWVSYDGTAYHGWQSQDGTDTIEGRLKEALRDLFGVEIEVIGASRTDAGVHALSNVAVFDAETRMPAEKICYALNQRLPEDIRVWKSEEVEEDFHPRHTDVEKTYIYRIHDSRIPNPLMTRYAYHTYLPLDVEKMNEAAQKLVGEHDFAAFCASGSQAKTTVRTILGIAVTREGDRMIQIRVRGTGFLYNMVRIIAGTLFEIGAGRRDAECISRALLSGNRTDAGPTAPPCGLCLEEIVYL